jgi:hypothetical protein
MDNGQWTIYEENESSFSFVLKLQQHKFKDSSIFLTPKTVPLTVIWMAEKTKNSRFSL